MAPKKAPKAPENEVAVENGNGIDEHDVDVPSDGADEAKSKGRGRPKKADDAKTKPTKVKPVASGDAKPRGRPPGSKKTKAAPVASKPDSSDADESDDHDNNDEKDTNEGQPDIKKGRGGAKATKPAAAVDGKAAAKGRGRPKKVNGD